MTLKETKNFLDKSTLVIMILIHFDYDNIGYDKIFICNINIFFKKTEMRFLGIISEAHIINLIGLFGIKKSCAQRLSCSKCFGWE